MEREFVGSERAIAEIAAGRMVVVTGTEQPDSAGKLVVGAQHATPDVVNFMARHARGLICLSLPPERCDELGLLPMTRRTDGSTDAAFTVSIEARHGVTTGISAHDRARTIQVAIDPASCAADLIHPGHVFPLRARAGGVLERSGHPEAALDLARLAGLLPAAVICEILNDEGAIAHGAKLLAFCRLHGLAMVAIDELTAHRRRHEQLVQRVACARLPTAHGDFRIFGYREVLSGEEHIALVKGDIEDRPPALVRLHTQCLTGDALGSIRRECGGQLHDALRAIANEGGVLVHLAQERDGSPLVEKMRAYSLQDAGGWEADDATRPLGMPVDGRDFNVAAQILRDLGVGSVRLMTNDPEEARTLEICGLPVTECVPLERYAKHENIVSLQTRRDRAQPDQAGSIEPLRSDDLQGVTIAQRRHGAGVPQSEDHSWMPCFEMAV